MSAIKAEIRAKALAVRQALSRDIVAAKSAAITNHVRALPLFQQTSCVLSYVASKDNEVDTRALIDELLDEQRRVLVPVAHADGTLTWSELRAWDDLARGRFGILEPRPECARPVQPPKDAICLVPGIAFNRDGYRIGYGGGYFDRFLKTFHGVSVGLAFREQIIEAWTPEEHDVAVNVLVTD